MFKKIAFHMLIGGAIWVLGACLHDFAKMRDLGNLLAYGGATYSGILAILILFNVRLPSPFSELLNNRKKAQAQKDLLLYKQLLDEEVITQSEFDSKATKLKKIIFHGDIA